MRPITEVGDEVEQGLIGELHLLEHEDDRRSSASRSSSTRQAENSSPCSMSSCPSSSPSKRRSALPIRSRSSRSSREPPLQGLRRPGPAAPRVSRRDRSVAPRGGSRLARSSRCPHRTPASVPGASRTSRPTCRRAVGAPSSAATCRSRPRRSPRRSGRRPPARGAGAPPRPPSPTARRVRRAVARSHPRRACRRRARMPSARHTRTGALLPLTACAPASSNVDRPLAREAGDLVHQHRLRIGDRLDPRGRVDRVAGHHPLLHAANLHCGLAGQNPHAHAQRRNRQRVCASAGNGLTTSRPARTARSASSSRAIGAPQTAITASPMNFSIVPP